METLAEALKDCGAIRFGEFTLSSGKKSNYYVDIKKASTNPRILKLIAQRISKILKTRSIHADYIGCVALGGVPVAAAVSLETGLPLIILRKEVKDYGIKEQIIGDFIRGKSVLMVEDVATTGNSVLKAIGILRNEDLEVKHAAVVVDREEGAAKALEDAGVELIPLVKISELLKGKK